MDSAAVRKVDLFGNLRIYAYFQLPEAFRRLLRPSLQKKVICSFAYEKESYSWMVENQKRNSLTWHESKKKELPRYVKTAIRSKSGSILEIRLVLAGKKESIF